MFRKLKSFKKPQRGSILYIVLVLVVFIFGLMLIGGKAYQQKKYNDIFVPDSTKGDKVRETLQLKTIPFKKAEFGCGYDERSYRGEPNIIWAVYPDPGGTIKKGESIKVWYTDELPLTLGAGSISPNTNNSDHVSDPNIGDPNAKAPEGSFFPVFPALFITDITTDLNDKSGDAQKGGTPHKPSDVYGVWKALGGSSTALFYNGLNLPPEAGEFPKKSNVSFNKNFSHPAEDQTSALIVWKVDSLGLTSGHSYRAQFIIHDGDQAGDIGEGCMTIQY